jgi:hypothetical protein
VLLVLTCRDTDYILVTTDTLEKAKTALQADGWTWNATRLG